MHQADEKYGKVRMSSYLPTHRAVKFLNYFRSAGWHNCNSQYRQHYAEGIEGAQLFFTVAGKRHFISRRKKVRPHSRNSSSHPAPYAHVIFY